MIEGVDHIAIAVENLDEAIKLYEETFELTMKHRECIEQYGVDVATFKIGETEIELVEGKTENSAIKKHVEKHGPGIHHIAMKVADIEDAMAKLKDSGVKFIDEIPRTGKEQSRVAFIRPSSTQKILYELVERKK